MANASNAYATVNPNKTNIGDIVQGIEQNDFAYREEKRRIDAVEQARKEKEQAKKDKLREKMLGQIPTNYDTGSSSLNEFQAKIIQKGVNRLGEIYKTLNNPNLNEDERIKLEIEAQNIDNLPNNLKIATDNFSNTIQDYKQGVSQGAYFQNPDFEKKVLSGFENYFGDLDNGLPVIGFADRNQDGAIDNLDIVPYDQLQQGIGNWSFQKQIDLQKIGDALAKNVGYESITTDTGVKSVMKKRPNEISILNVATNALKNPDGSYTDTALSEMRKMGIEPSEESFKQVEEKLFGIIKAQLDTEYKENVDSGAQLGWAKFNKEKKDEELAVTTVNLSNTALGNDSFGGKPINKKGILEKGLNLGKGINFETIGGAKTGLDNSTVTNLFLNDKNEIIFTANVLDKKASKEEQEDFMTSGTTTNPSSYRTETRKATGATEATIANKLGYNNANDLKAYIKSLNSKTGKTGKTEAEQMGI